MRILKEFDQADIKITIFSWNGKISVKFEKNLVEIIYKFRDGSGIESLSEAEAFLNESFLVNIGAQLVQLSTTRFERWKEWNSIGKTDMEIEKII